MLYNDYRPQKFTEVVGQKDIIDNLMSQSAKDRFFGVYILCGQYGSGKTTTARILAMAANCKHKDEYGNPCGECEDCRAIREGSSSDVQEIAAAVNTGVDKVREICETVSYQPISLRKKVYIIDEVQALSKSAFQAFLKMLEEPPAHAMFILATTDIGAIPPTVRSRSAVYYFKQLTQAEISVHCRKVSELEGLSVTQDACDVIAKYSQGSMRNALSLLDMATQEGAATGEKVEKLLGVSTPDAVFALIREVLAGNAAEVIRQTTILAEGGADLSVLVSDMLHIVADLTVASVSVKSVKGTEHYLSLIAQTVVLGSSMRFTAIADELFRAKQQMARNADLSVLVVSLIRLTRRDDVVKYSDAPNEDVELLRATVKLLAEKVDMLEGRIASGDFIIPSMAEQEAVKPEEAEEVAIEITGTEKVSENVQESSCVTEDDADANEKDVTEPIAEEADERPVIEEVDQKVEECSFEDDFFSDFISVGAKKTELESVTEPNETETYSKMQVPESEVDVDESAMIALLRGDVTQAELTENAAQLRLRKLADEPLFRAVLSCCSVNLVGDEVKITSDIPVAKTFLGICLAAYEQQGYDVNGLTIV